MKFTNEIINTIKQFAIDNVEKHPNDIVCLLCSHFGITKPTAKKYMDELVADKIVAPPKKGRYPAYHLMTAVTELSYALADSLEEDVIWRKDFMPLLSDIKDNVLRALQYSFTEMVNNVIDHSSAISMTVTMLKDAKKVQFYIYDDGIGIFNKIQKDLGLDNPKQSILELAKGKFTSDAKRHSGEGIFFTSRICDGFAIMSGNLRFWGHKGEDIIFEDKQMRSGTCVAFEMNRSSSVSIADIFNEYSDPDAQPSFFRTRIPVKLMEYEGEALLSRSQAKRLINRFDRFLEVILDFEGVTEIGQAFADEIFRVFHNDYPDVHLIPVNCSQNVKRMIAHVSVEYCQDVYNKDIKL